MNDVDGWVLRVRDAALRAVQTERGVRVEDYLTTLAAATGEAALAATGFPVEAHDLPPGSPLFVEAVNPLLAGPHPGCVWAMLQATGEPLPDPVALYEGNASRVGSADWGFVATTVPEANRPNVMALRAAYELRPVVLEVERSARADVGQRHVLTAAALASAITQTRDAIDVATAVLLSCEVVVALAKTAPMTDAAFRAATTG